MGIQVRDERQMKALTGLSQAQFDDLLPAFSDIYGATQLRHYEEGVASGTRRRQTGRWHQRQIAHHDREAPVCPLLLQDLSHVRCAGDGPAHMRLCWLMR